MKVVRGRLDARSLPSRHHYALFRLVAFVRMQFAKREEGDVALTIDRHQSAIENYAMAIWIVLTVACYVSGTLFARWPLPLALLAAIPIAIIVMNIPIVIGGLLRRSRNNIRLNTFVVMLLLIAAAAYYARSESWLRFVAFQFLALVAINAMAAAIVFFLRGSIAKMEATFAAG